MSHAWLLPASWLLFLLRKFSWTVLSFRTFWISPSDEMSCFSVSVVSNKLSSNLSKSYLCYYVFKLGKQGYLFWNIILSFSPCKNCSYCYNIVIGMKLFSGWFAAGSFRLFFKLCNFKPALVWTISIIFFGMSSSEGTNLVLVDTWFGIKGDWSSSLNYWISVFSAFIESLLHLGCCNPHCLALLRPDL